MNIHSVLGKVTVTWVDIQSVLGKVTDTASGSHTTRAQSV